MINAVNKFFKIFWKKWKGNYRKFNEKINKFTIFILYTIRNTKLIDEAYPYWEKYKI